jgi:hypothetical protein
VIRRLASATGALAALVALVATVTPARADDKATAEAAYDRAKQLVKAGNYAEACPLFETSYHADPQIGVLLNLADCHENVGRTATALSEFREAIEITRKRGDTREAYAQSRADALAPKVPKLHLVPPAKPIAGFAVRRDTTDVTVLVGTDLPVDPGEHELVATAPGYKTWTKKITVAADGATTSVELPALDKEPDKVAVVEKPAVHEGTLTIVSKPGAEILLDSEHVGIGRYEGKVKSGGHTLRVVADGMRTYQSEIFVGIDETRTVDVPLEKETVIGAGGGGSRAPTDDGPGFELGASTATGVKLNGDQPLVVAQRAELAFRLGRRVNFGLFVEYGSISTGNACGFDMPGPLPSTPFDFGAHNQFTRCTYVMPGLQLYVHVLPKRAIDPYVGITPGFRFGFVDWKPYVGDMALPARSEIFPGIVSGIRAGVDYHPTPSFRAWEVGGFVEASITIFGQESTHDTNHNGKTFTSLFGGLRSTVAF